MVVKVGDILSVVAGQTFGVPQVSTVFLAHFCLWYRSSQRHIKSEVFQYANDTAIITAHEDLTVAQEIFQEAFDRM